MYDSGGSARYAHVNSLTGSWELAASGDSMNQITFSLLHNASSDGANGFVPYRSSTAYWLQEDSSAHTATAAAK